MTCSRALQSWMQREGKVFPTPTPLSCQSRELNCVPVWGLQLYKCHESAACSGLCPGCASSGLPRTMAQVR